MPKEKGLKGQGKGPQLYTGRSEATPELCPWGWGWRTTGRIRRKKRSSKLSLVALGISGCPK